jgi:hypothetical protein
LVRFQEHLSHLIGLGVTKKSQATETYYQLSAFEKILRQAQNDDDEEGKGESKGKKEREGEEGEEGERKRKRDSTTKKDHSGKTKREKQKSSLEKEISTPSISGRLIHRSKWIKNKRVDQYSAEHLREILGSFPENKV